MTPQSYSERRLVRGGLVVTPTALRPLDILIRGEKVEALAVGAESGGAEIVDAAGMIVLPGAVDGHTHFIQDDPDLADPDPDEHEGFEHGGRGAAAGGVTTVIEMPQARPAVTDGSTFARKRELAARSAVVDFALWGGVVPSRDPEAVHDHDPAAIREQIREGAVGFKAFMCNSDPTFPGIDDAQLVATLAQLADTPHMLAVHAENDALLRAGLDAMGGAGRTDPLAHAESRPPIVEREAVSRAILFAEWFGAWVHIVHVSTAGAAEEVAAAKARRVRVTCETCPHYLTLDHDDLRRLGPFARCAPPLRSRDDVEGLWQHLAAGTIDCITTDHCGFTHASRVRGQRNIFNAPNGLPGIETFVPVTISEARSRSFDWPTIARLIASNPAKLWHLAPRKGVIEPGADADLCIIDPERRWTVRGDKLHHTHKWTPFEGLEVAGKVVHTMVRGRTVYAESQEGELAPSAGWGKFVCPSTCYGAGLVPSAQAAV